jgi:hypothetical protein
MKKKLAIIVPYRDRPTHLKTFVSHMKSYLKEYDYEIIVVEQFNNKPFNRGKLLNVGAKYANDNGFDYLCFHDVDMLPIKVDYSYPEYPTSLISELENKDGNIFFSYFGGITLFKVEDFFDINGYSNNYWGWGFEDTDLFYRVTHGGLFFDTETIGEDNYSFIGSISLKELDYIKIPITSSFINNDFEIKLTAKIESKYFDENKEYDEFPILSIPGYNIGLFYNSFNRFFIQIYDQNKKPYSITSDILDDITSIFKFIKVGNKVSFHINEKLIGEIEMDKPILDLNNKFMYVGSFSEKENIEFDMDLIDLNINGYSLGTNDFEMFGGIINEEKVIPHKTSLPKPIRREGLFRELYHDTNASINKSWVHQETRKNQIYYNNFVKQNLIDFTKEGLNSLNYNLISESDNLDYKILSVEI